MYSKNNVLLLLGALGLVTGMAVSSIAGEDRGTYCQDIQNEIKENQSFQGSVACYPPGAINVNLSQKVEDNSELKCVCRMIDDSDTGIFPVVRSN